MNCPRCQQLLQEGEIRRLNAQLNRSKAGPVDPEKAKARAVKAARARWGKERD